MRILITGHSIPNALETQYLKCLNELGNEVMIFPTADLFQNYYHRSLLNKIIVRLNISGIFKHFIKNSSSELKI